MDKKAERRKVKARLFTIISKMDEVKSLAMASDNYDLISGGFQNFHQELINQHYSE